MNLKSHGAVKSFRHDLQVEYDFAEEHVFERRDGSGAVDGVVALEGLEEVGVGRFPVLLLCCVDDPCSGRQHTAQRSNRPDDVECRHRAEERGTRCAGDEPFLDGQIMSGDTDRLFFLLHTAAML